MKKLLIIIIICFNAMSVFAQTQKFDIMTFTPPKGWTVQNGDNAKVFTKIDKAKNTLGIIMLYPSINSSGDANDDFKYVWKQIVQESFGAGANPEIETGESNGFKVVNGGELIKYEGIQALAMLTVLSGKGKAISILTITNEQSYANVTQALMDSMNIESKAVAPQNATNSKNEPIERKINSSGKLSGSGIVGVWVCYTQDFSSNSGMNWFTRVYFNDGTFLSTMPENGPNEVGTIPIGNYSFANGIGKEKLPEWNNPQPIKTVKANQIKVDSRLFLKSEELSGRTFNGSYTTYANSSDPDLKTLPKGNRPVINFFSNGSFWDEGVFRAVLRDYSKPESFGNPGKGTYQIKDYTIYFKYDDGRERNLAIYTWGISSQFPRVPLFLGSFQMNPL